MNTRQDNELIIGELDEAIAFLSEECRMKRQEDNSAAVRDLSSHIVRLIKERTAILEKAGKLISLAEAKAAMTKADDILVDAIAEIAPDYLHLILQRQAEKYLETDQPFGG